VKKRVMAVAAVVAAGLGVATLSAGTTHADQQAAALGTTFMETFDGPLDTDFWYVSDNYNNGGHQNCQFNKKNAKVADGLLSVSIDDTAYGDRKYSCGSIQTNPKYHYGTFETRMKTGKASGTNSSLFTYAGPYQDVPKSHEIDFETLGKDTTKTEVNSWVNGDPKGPEVVDLGLDNSQEWVDLAFVWTEEKLTFYVNRKEVYSFTGADVPYEPQLIIPMIWSTDTLTDWMGKFTYPGKPIVSQYDYVAYTALGDECQFEGSVACDVEAPKMSYVDNFDKLDATKWQVSDGWNNGEQQNCTWDKTQVAASEGTLNLSFAKKAVGEREYACSEVQYKKERGFGTYEARMKGVANPGVLSALFTWAGASGDLPSESTDVKLQGNKPSQVKFHVGQNGESLSPKFVDLPTTGEFVDYGVKWSAERVDFYVNGEVVHSITDPAQIPDRATRPFFTIWGSDTLTDELGEFTDPGKTLTLQVDRFAYTAPGEDCQFEGSIAC
jgi:beta-glucanase (GH16 family)